MNPQDSEWNRLFRDVPTTTSQWQGSTLWTIAIWYAISFPRRKGWKFGTQRHRWKKNGNSSRQFNLESWKINKVKNDKEVILEVERNKSKVHFLTLMDLSHLKRGVRTPSPEVQRLSCASWGHCERWFWSICGVHEKGDGERTCWSTIWTAALWHFLR